MAKMTGEKIMKKSTILLKELDLIQSVITRMASYAFLSRGWVITIVVGVFTIGEASLITKLTTTIFTIPFFWFIDAFFLHKERAYRKLYDWVTENRLSTKKHAFSLNYNRKELFQDSVLKTMFRPLLLVYYLLPLLVATIGLYYTMTNV